MRLQFAFIATLPLLIAGCTAKTTSEATAIPVAAALESETSTAGVETTAVAFNVDRAPTCEISVPGMMCEHCTATVRQALLEQPGVKEVKVDLESKTAVVAIDENVFDADAAVSLLEDEYSYADTSLKTEAMDAKAPVTDAIEEAATADATAG